VHFDNLCLFSDAQVEKFGYIQNVMTVITSEKKPQIECHEMEPDLLKDRAIHEGDNPLFEMNVLFFFLHS
jgi:hypothetical protein